MPHHMERVKDIFGTDNNLISAKNTENTRQLYSQNMCNHFYLDYVVTVLKITPQK